MRKIKKLKKLQVTKQTLRNLSEDQTEQAAGGLPTLTSGSVHGGACCTGCGCIRTEVICLG